MECHACGRHVESGDRFCNGCGASLHGVADTTQPVATADDPESSAESTGKAPSDEQPKSEPANKSPNDPAKVAGGDEIRTELIPIVEADIWDEEPTWAPTGATPTQPVERQGGAVATTDLPATEPITEVWMESVPTDDDDTPAATPYDFVEREPVAVTAAMPTQSASATEQMSTILVAPPAPVGRFRVGLIMLIALVAGLVSLVALFADVIVITSDVRLVATDDMPAGFRTGTWILDDLADNLSIAGLIAVVLMVMGGVASSFRWRWGSGLAGGAGLAMAGLAAVGVGLAQMPIEVAHQFANIPAENPFVLTITRDLGYWLLVVAGALGVVLFFASINDAIGDHRSGLNPWIAALGALAVVVAAAGPLLPENQAVFSDNWYLIEGVGEPPAILLTGRLVQLALLLVGGVLGFLSVRRWGLGVAIGVSLPAIWLTLSVLFEVTTTPIGLGFRNPGADDMHVHGVTIIGVSAVLAMIVLGLIAAYDQGIRERH